MDREKLRQEVAKEYKLALYRQYSEKEAAAILSKDVGTLKRWRKQGILPHMRLGDSVRYFGYQLVDVLIGGTRDEGDATAEGQSPSRESDECRVTMAGSGAASGTSRGETIPGSGTASGPSAKSSASPLST